MIIRLVPMRVPLFWDYIKYALKKVEDLGTDNEKGVYNHVFAKLMADKMQCYLIGDEEVVDGIILTEILENSVTLKSTLMIRAIYAFNEQDERIWNQALGLIKRAAKRDGCYRILMTFYNSKIIDIGLRNGFSEISKVLEYSLGD